MITQVWFCNIPKKVGLPWTTTTTSNFKVHNQNLEWLSGGYFQIWLNIEQWVGLINDQWSSINAALYCVVLRCVVLCCVVLCCVVLCNVVLYECSVVSIFSYQYWVGLSPAPVLCWSCVHAPDQFSDAYL